MRQAGQGVIEYALVLVLFMVVVMVIGAILTNPDSPNSSIGQYSYYWDRYEECMAEELYTETFCAAWANK